MFGERFRRVVAGQVHDFEPVLDDEEDNNAGAHSQESVVRAIVGIDDEEKE